MSYLPHKINIINETARQILAATESLMAQEGLAQISMHKIAKVAGLSAGTLYLHFENKEALLNQLSYYLIERFHRYLCYEPGQPLFEQYQQMWRSIWQFLQDNPSVTMNFYQYEALPHFQQLISDCFDCTELYWNQFIERGVKEKVIAPLPKSVLWGLSIGAALKLAYLQVLESEYYSELLLDEIIQRTWKAITL